MSIETAGPDWLPTFIGDRIGHPSSATLVPTAEDADLEDLKNLPELNEVFLSRTGVTDAGLNRLAPLTHLEALHLNGTRITDAGLEQLSQLQSLRVLFLDSTQITDAGLVHLARLKDLNTLGIAGTEVSDKGLSKIASVDLFQMTVHDVETGQIEYAIEFEGSRYSDDIVVDHDARTFARHGQFSAPADEGEYFIECRNVADGKITSLTIFEAQKMLLGATISTDFRRLGRVSGPGPIVIDLPNPTPLR